MPRFDYTLDDFYAMAQAAKPVLEAAAATSTDEAQQRGLRLALLLVIGVREFARELDAARARNETGLIEKLSHQLVKSCSPAPGHFRATRFRTEVRVQPLVREAEEWLLKHAPDAQKSRYGEFTFEPNAWLELREEIEAAGLTVARPPVARRRVTGTDAA
jgi:hypothetical protein